MNFITPTIQASIVAILGAFLASGCSSIVKQSYKVTPRGPNVALSPYSGATEVFGSMDPDGDGVRLAKEGYVRIGIASFKTDGHVTFEQLQAQARDVGADVVIFSTKNPASRQALQPIALNNDGTPHALTAYTHLNSMAFAGGNYGGTTSVGGGMKDFNGSVTSSGIPGISSSDMAAINAPEYDYKVSFWRKAANGPVRSGT